MALRLQNIFEKGTSGLISGSLWSKVEPGAKKRYRHGILELQEKAVQECKLVPHSAPARRSSLSVLVEFSFRNLTQR